MYEIKNKLTKKSVTDFFEFAKRTKIEQIKSSNKLGTLRRYETVLAKFKEFTNGNINIGNDVWIGRSSIVLGGVKINDGAVVGAGSVVTKEVPHYAIVAGSPAKIIKYRFDEDTIQQLIKINWWSFSDAELSRFAHTIKDVKLFIDTISKSKRL